MTQSWRSRAACLGADPELFFPSTRRQTTRTWKDARALCATCPVKQQCLDVALRVPAADDRWGMFGGTTPSERRRLRRLV